MFQWKLCKKDLIINRKFYTEKSKKSNLLQKYVDPAKFPQEREIWNL
jgi:hypothetical protein